MKKVIFLFLLCSSIALGEMSGRENSIFPEHEVKIEKTFIEKNDELKERLDILKEHERNVLRMEEASGINRTEELENLDEKYERFLKKFTSLSFKTLSDKEQEEKLLKFEEENYKDFHKRITDIEKKYSK